MVGKLYGLGVGPGDPELLTLKALRRIKESEIIAVPGKKKEESVAYKIARQAYPQIENKEVLPIDFPMTKDSERLEESHRLGASQIAEKLREGKSVAFLTLGDPTVYATYLYVHKRILAMGFEAEIVSGITSFCAVAARIEHRISGEGRAAPCNSSLLSDRGSAEAAGNQGVDESRQEDRTGKRRAFKARRGPL